MGAHIGMFATSDFPLRYYILAVHISLTVEPRCSICLLPILTSSSILVMYIIINIIIDIIIIIDVTLIVTIIIIYVNLVIVMMAVVVI